MVTDRTREKWWAIAETVGTIAALLAFIVLVVILAGDGSGGGEPDRPRRHVQEVPAIDESPVWVWMDGEFVCVPGGPEAERQQACEGASPPTMER